ncbi:MAG: hypothetical protein IAG13_12890 [Deltaproteobacteria bacterium]|nr:hypothetical protein [Nannocystaceae bacterium]
MYLRDVPGHGPVVFRLPELYPTDRSEEDFDLAYRRRLGMLRLADFIEDQLGLDPDEAVVVAAGLIGGVGEA